MSDNHRHDDMLFEMLQECKTVPKFFDEIFGFLQRRTDFYHIAKEPNAAVGLPEGLAEKIVKYSFYKSKPAAPTELYSQIENIQDAIVECVADNVTEATFPVSCEKNNQKFSFTKSESYNGSVYENYCWSQTIADVDVIVKVPENISKKDIYVEILPGSLSIKLDTTTLLSGELCEKCKANDAIWSIDGCKLEIHLDKSQEKWWDCLVKSEPNLDISKIDCSRPYEDLSEEAQAKIEELQWNQERKRLGLPTSDELGLHNTLKKAWGAEGSPFSGPFDPNAVCLN